MMATVRAALTIPYDASRAAVPLSLCAALAAGLLVVVQPALVALLAVLLPTMLLAWSPRARILFIVFGGLAVFQSSDELTPQKLLFFVGAAIAVVGALARSQKLTSERSYRDVAPLFQASVAFTVLILVSLPVSMAHGTPQTVWLRDAAPYMLFAAAPLFAFDAQSAFSERALRRIFVIAGLAGSAAFAARWLSERGIASISGVFGLPTLMLGAAVFAYAMAATLEGDRNRMRWLALAAAIFAGFLSTGTRSSVVLLAAPIAIVFGARRHFARRSVRLAIVLPVVVLLVVLGVQSLMRVAGASRDAFSARVQLALSTGKVSDQSYLDRRVQTAAAWELFKQAPILGVGPGAPITWTNSAGVTTSAASVDSPVAYLSKFGLLGLWPLVVLGWSFRLALGRFRERTGERTIPQLGLIGFAAIVVAWSILQVPFEDKGLASGFLLLLAIALSEASKEPESAG